jgi:hypothetical protein
MMRIVAGWERVIGALHTHTHILILKSSPFRNQHDQVECLYQSISVYTVTNGNNHFDIGFFENKFKIFVLMGEGS